MFHYVSGSPWQLHKLLGEFVGGHFPEGAFHMKDVRKIEHGKTQFKD